jgi:hypothetical protein
METSYSVGVQLSPLAKREACVASCLLRFLGKLKSPVRTFRSSGCSLMAVGGEDRKGRSLWEAGKERARSRAGAQLGGPHEVVGLLCCLDPVQSQNLGTNSHTCVHPP